MSAFINPTFIISILIALSFHEFAHGFIANKLGDPTAEEQGRLTLNPVAHLDPLGSLLFLLVGFGWGKPVPVDPRYFRHPKRDTALVSLAGPASNFLLAGVFFLLYMLVMRRAPATSVLGLLSVPVQGSVGMVFLRGLFQSSIFVNLGLMSFNLLPVAPLDGSKILQAFIPLRYELEYERFMRWGPFVLLGIFLAETVLPFSILSAWILTISHAALELFRMLFGWL